MRSTTLDGNRFVGEFVQFPFRKALAADFPFIRLGRAAQEIDEAVVPDFVSELWSIPTYFEKDDDTEIHEFTGVATASVVTLDDTSGGLGQNEEIIAALAEDQEFEGAACRCITFSDVDYPIVSVNALTRAITVTGTPTAGAVSIYPFRRPTEAGKVKLLKNDGLVLATAGASGRVVGLQTRTDGKQADQMQQITERIDRLLSRLPPAIKTGAFSVSLDVLGTSVGSGGDGRRENELRFDSANSPDARTGTVTCDANRLVRIWKKIS